MPRNLLILQKAKNAKNTGFAQARYTAGTQPFQTGGVNLIGRPVPDLELRDRQYKAISTSRLNGTPTLITFWAPRCGPCLEELVAPEELQEGLDRQFQVVAVAVQDRREKAPDFIQAHPQYKFLFFTDPIWKTYRRWVHSLASSGSP